MHDSGISDVIRMVVKRVRRILRLFNVDVRKQQPDNSWVPVPFWRIAEMIQSLPTDLTQSPNRYHVKDGERWFVDFKFHSDSASQGPVHALALRCRGEGLPVVERRGNRTHITLRSDETLAEPHVFGVFDSNRLLLQINMHGLNAGQLKLYLHVKANEVLRHQNDTSYIDVDITPVTRPTFEKVMEDAIGFTRIHIRSKYNKIGRLNQLSGSESLPSKLASLLNISRNSAKVELSVGKYPVKEEAFLAEFADWAREHMRYIQEENLFDVLEGSAVLRSGEMKLFDLMDRHRVEKRVTMHEVDGTLDVDRATGQLGGVYNDILRDEGWM